MINDNVVEFFNFALERDRIWMQKEVVKKPAPWTSDPYLHKYSFTNVYREKDAVTRWMRKNVTDPRNTDVSGFMHDVIPASLVFRWFNRIEIGEIVFNNTCDVADIPYDQFMLSGLPEALTAPILKKYPNGPFVNGAYIIKGYDGMDKLHGVVRCLQNVRNHDWESKEVKDIKTMQHMTEYLQRFPYMGAFMAYEIACDLRYTSVLENAPDKMTWANPGPGAARGLKRIMTGNPEGIDHKDNKIKLSTYDMIGKMQYLLEKSVDYFPGTDLSPRWEMREVEHTLCEYDKWKRLQTGGRVRRTYKPNVSTSSL
jgi:hypothetical protein